MKSRRVGQQWPRNGHGSYAWQQRARLHAGVVVPAQPLTRAQICLPDGFWNAVPAGALDELNTRVQAQAVAHRHIDGLGGAWNGQRCAEHGARCTAKRQRLALLPPCVRELVVPLPHASVRPSRRMVVMLVARSGRASRLRCCCCGSVSVGVSFCRCLPGAVHRIVSGCLGTGEATAAWSGCPGKVRHRHLPLPVDGCAPQPRKRLPDVSQVQAVHGQQVLGHPHGWVPTGDAQLASTAAEAGMQHAAPVDHQHLRKPMFGAWDCACAS
jgi:hypothetical protein